MGADQAKSPENSILKLLRQPASEYEMKTAAGFAYEVFRYENQV